MDSDKDSVIIEKMVRSIMIQSNKTIYKRALFLAVPMMIQNGITNGVALVDNLMVGSLGTERMTAVAIVGQLIFVFNLAVFGGLSGPGIFGAQYYGRGDTEGMRNIFRLKWWVGCFCALVGTLVFLLGGNALISLYLRGEGNGIDAGLTLTIGREYMLIMLAGLLPFVVTQVYSSSLRETGESLKPMIAGICAVVTDVLFNYLLIFGKLGLPRLEVKGAAIATVLSRFVEMVVMIVLAHKNIDKYKFLQHVYRTMKVPLTVLNPSLRKGFPIFMNEFLWAGGVAVLTQCYSIRGLNVVAGINISNAICNMLNVVFVALGHAVGIVIGQMLGAKQFDDAKKDSVRLMWFSGAISALVALLLLSISHIFPQAYDTTAEVRRYGQYFIMITAAFFPLQAFLNAMYFTLRSGGKTVITFVFDSMYSWVVSVPAAFVLCTFTSLPVLFIYAMIQALDFIKVMVGYVLIKKGVWITSLVE